MHIATHQATSRDPLVVAGVVATRALIGLIATGFRRGAKVYRFGGVISCMRADPPCSRNFA
jgi:hypothetical protein